MKVLLLEDELMLQSAIVEYLEDTGFHVDAVEDGEEAYHKAVSGGYDLFVFDINTPTIDGLSLLEKLQKEKIHTPAIFISAITKIEQISRAYELGCYDYLKKPFHLKELTLHINRLLDIAGVQPQHTIAISRFYSYDLQNRRLLFDKREEPLTKRQAQIIDLLATRIGTVVDFDTLRYYIWKDNEIDNATIRAEMHRVRKMLKEDLIEGIKGVGYRLKKL